MYLALGKGVVLQLNKLESPPYKDALVNFTWKSLSGSGVEVKNVNSLQTEGQTENRQQVS